MRESNPKVSIIIPVYNGAIYMREAIDSALAQTYENVEVIVVNDGSSDDGKTDKVARSYGDRIRYFNKENGGVASALNLGIREMQGEYFSWLSHDDVYYPKKIEAEVNYLNGSPPGTIVYCNFELIDATSKVFATDCCGSAPPEDFLYNLITKGHVNGCTMMIPKRCFDEIGVFDESLPTTQDYALWFLFAQTYHFVQLSQVLVQSRVHAGQGSNVIPTHWQAVNDLHRWFIDEVDAKNLLRLSQADKIKAYLAIAGTFNDRFFYSAGMHAAKLALNHAQGQGLTAVLRNLPSVVQAVFNSKKMEIIHFLTIHKKRLVG